MLSFAIIIAIIITTKNKYLANKVNCIETIVEVTLSSVKLILNTKLINCNVV
jgi:hypothetical protein